MEIDTKTARTLVVEEASKQKAKAAADLDRQTGLGLYAVAHAKVALQHTVHGWLLCCGVVRWSP